MSPIVFIEGYRLLFIQFWWRKFRIINDLILMTIFSGLSLDKEEYSLKLHLFKGGITHRKLKVIEKITDFIWINWFH